MAGQQSKGLRESAKTRGWDPTPEWFNPEFDTVPNAGNNVYLNESIPAGQPRPLDGTADNPKMDEKVSWSAPKPSMGADSKKGGNPYGGMPM